MGLPFSVWACSAILAVSCSSAQAAAETVVLTLDSGRDITVNILRPDTPGPHAALMLFGGFQHAAQVLERLPADVPLLRASFDYPYDPPRKFRFPGGMKYLPDAKRAFAESFEGIERLTAYLRTRPDVDPQRITIAGASLGAPFATVAGARLAIPGVVIVHGFGRIEDVAAQQFIRKWEPKHGRWVRWPARRLAGFLAWYLELPRPEDHAQRMSAQQRVLVVDAIGDTSIPQDARDALWTALQQSDAQIQRLQLPGDHLKSEASAQIADILARALEWMKQQQLL